MAKTPSKQQASMNELGGLPPEFEVDTQQSVPDVQKETSTSEEPPEISDDQNKVSGETETQGKTTESELESDAPADDSDEMELVVVKGQTVRHSGETYAENSYLYLPHDAAKRLIKLGVVADVKALRQQSASTIGPSITVDDGVKINRGG
ncbi:hypothetical protein [Yersinia frederiksenii]|uniref:hypothetical protein n=1 Tax=Yersinia frederiksenii TaxID=29484 RepID=UPI0011AAD6C8|nr:hypothetical protein [Yersinia frederiksenii]